MTFFSSSAVTERKFFLEFFAQLANFSKSFQATKFYKKKFQNIENSAVKETMEISFLFYFKK
jgi:hypothetical protein